MNRLKKSKIQTKAAQVIQRNNESLIAAVSHDLMNPLAAIQLSLDMILQTLGQEQVADPLRTTIKNQVERASRSSKKMMGLIEDLIDQTKIESGTFEIEKDRHRLSKLVRQLSAEFKPIAEHHNITLEFVSSITENTVADFDFSRMNQLLSNLLDLAIKFTTRGGSIKMHIRVSEDEILFELEDSGCGIPNENLKTTFEAYCQDKNVSRPGTDLGPFIARAIITSHGGKVEAGSALGEASRFRVMLPRWTFSRPADDEAGLVNNISPDKPIKFIFFSKSYRVLLVDDDDDLRAVMKNMMESLNLVVIDVSNGAEALKICEAQAFDLLVIDYRICDMTGADLARAIEKKHLKKIPLILVSADVDLLEKVLPNNIIARIAKPIDLPTFIESVEKALPQS